MEKYLYNYNLIVTSKYENNFIIKNKEDLNNIIEYVDKKTCIIKDFSPLIKIILNYTSDYHKILKPHSNVFYITFFCIVNINNTGYIQNWITYTCETNSKKVRIKNINDNYTWFDEILEEHFYTFTQYFDSINENYKNHNNCNYIINKNNSYYEINFLFN